MPVGFENSALKMSFSLSSLQSGGGQGSPQQVMMQVERPYNSLTKKTRGNLEREMWRRSWGTQEEKKDDFWAALQPNYNYLMDNNLIESCKEANGELSCDEEDVALLSKWSFKDFTAQFSEICSWLNDIREAVYGKEENIRDRNLRLEHVEAMQRNVYKRKLFTEQAKRLLLEHSELQDEVTWRVNYLNSKWDMLEQSISPSKADSQKNFCADVEHEAGCLKEWIREMERRLKPLNMHTVNEWIDQDLVEKITECKVLHQDIKAHGKVVAAVLKRAGLAEAAASAQLAKRLERRWHLLFLRSLEWQYHLENLLKRRNCPRREHEHLCSESDEEPLSKHPRLSSGDCSDHLTDDGSYFEDDIKDFWMKDKLGSSQTPCTSSSTSRREASYEQNSELGLIVGPDSVLQRKLHQIYCKINKETTRRMKHEETPLAAGATSSASTQSTGTSPLENEDNSFNQSNRKARNCATFYFKHRDADPELAHLREHLDAGIASLHSKVCEVKCVEESSDEEWTYTSGRRSQVPKDRVGPAAPLLSSLRKNVAVRLDFGEDNSEKVLRSEETENIQCRNSENSVQNSESVDSDGNETFALPKLTENNQDCIRWLVRQAELLVREDTLICSGETKDPTVHVVEMTSSQAKHARIKQWLPDSCDASGEYTTGDSDGECSVDSREESSGISLVNKHLETLLNSRPHLDSAEGFSDPNVTLKAENSEQSPDIKETSVKVVTRKQRCKRQRPWSVSGISQLSPQSPMDEKSSLANFSSSESALHQMMSASTPLIREKECSTVSVQDNMSSSTVYENTKTPVETHTGSLQRRRGKQRKKSYQAACVRSESACDAVNPLLSTGSVSSSPRHKNGTKNSKGQLTKSHDMGESFSPAEPKTRSFSETTCTSATSEQNTVSDSSVFPTESSSSKAVDAGDATIGSEEEPLCGKHPGFPAFRLGPEQGVVTPLGATAAHPLLRSGAESDVDRTSGAQAADEQLSSSEQAWDNYQEKYMSEPYSEEIADPEVSRRLLEFGDDYHNFLDSQSDYSSSVEVSQKASPMRKRKSIVGAGDSSVLDSDSDLEDIHHLIKQSQSHLIFTEQVLSKHVSKSSTDMWVYDYAEIVATCRENKRCLRVILENVKEGEILSTKERKDIGVLLENWDALQIHADELQRVSALQQKLITLRKKLLDTTTRVASLMDNLDDLTHLESIIQTLKEELQSLLALKDQLLHLNVAVHELVTEPVSPSGMVCSVTPQLKEDVTDLYRVWSDSFQSVSSRLSQLERAVETWHQFDKELSDLQTTLEGDHSTLASLCKSLDDGGAAIGDVAGSIRDIARVLSEVPGASHKNCPTSCQESQDASILAREGSLSDSGISDSGSEHEMSERARRLASLRQLASHLQTELGTSDGLVSQINERIEHLDHELRQLQDVCRKLIVRSTFWPGVPQPEALPGSDSKAPEDSQPDTSVVAETSTKDASQRLRRPSPLKTMVRVAEPRRSKDDGEDPKVEPRQPWFWRVARAAIPVQITLVTLLCLACFFEPHCCESVNNLSLTLSPQLRYVYGPPPV